ncbi:hypothetical protein Dimus_004472 [Dionaea muscipula]
MAIYTAECTHAFHFPCIAAHVRKLGSLICPVCNVTWKDVPLLSVHKNNLSTEEEEEEAAITAAAACSNPATPIAASRVCSFEDKRLIQSYSIRTKTKQQRDFQYNLYYNDDEPLFSPTAARFVAIPEEEQDVEEEEEEEHRQDGDDDDDQLSEDVEEFQGFFVNPTPSTRNKVKNGQSNVEVKLLPEAAVISVGRTHETFAVALKVKAPAHRPPLLAAGDAAPPPPPLQSPSYRAPIDLVTVLDVSGSMNGAKLQMLKRAMRFVISSLGSADRLSIVAFSATSQRLIPLRRMTPHGQRTAIRIVDQLVCGQGKCADEPLRKASKVLEDRREKNPVASIILLSDGHDEEVHGGGSNHQRLPQPCHDSSIRFAHIEIPVRSFGCEPVEDAFARCVRGILSVVVQDLRIRLGFGSGSAAAEIMAVYSSNRRPKLLSCDSARLGDLYAGEERELLIELKVPISSIGSHHVISVRCSYRDPATQKFMNCKERALLVPRPHAVRSTDPRIERLRKGFVANRAVAESRRLVEHGDFTSAQHLLSSAHAVLTRSGQAAVDHEFTRLVEAAHAELQRLREYQKKEEAVQVQPRRRTSKKEGAATTVLVDENGEPLTPTSAWRAAERLAKVAMMKKSLNKVRDLHGFENARF